MDDSIQIINPTQHKGWEDLILSHPEASFFHSSAWARVLSESYGYVPKYFAMIRNEKLVSLLPVMEVNSLFTGKRGVSLPFTDYCEPIVGPEVSLDDLLNCVVDTGKRSDWKSLELRIGQKALPNRRIALKYLGHELKLGQDEERLLSGFRDSTRRNIRKAIGEGVEVKSSNTTEGMKEFYRLNSLTRKEHGLPPQPYRFFVKVLEHIISRDLGQVYLASRAGKNIAGAIYFHFNGKAYYKYGASDKNYQHLRPNNLVMWEAIRCYSGNGTRSLCMGRTEPDHEGLLQFKSGWGTTEQPIRYYRYDFKKGSFVSGSSKVTGFHNKIFKNMPIPILNKIGALLYKHVA
ncbi:MAG: peptidoglycan bridge formation glycyltransferase FemA/FemB family protein [Deltaproteobacteria bacterium]|nr:peptidoglycan bridge formation glycyltransferase FemA/FemB family protein [Deltaproteobacteria bacterium]